MEAGLDISVDERDVEIWHHYHEYIGEENREFRFDDLPEQVPNPIRILEFAPPSDEYDWVYATVGGSKKLQTGQFGKIAITHRTELIIYSNVQSDEIVNTLLALTMYPFIGNTAFGPGHLVPGSPGHGIVTGSPLTDILLTKSYSMPEDVHVVQHPDGDNTHILYMVPIYASERLFAREHGYEELEYLFGNQDADTSDFWRKPVV